MTRFRKRPSPALVVACIALAVALGGTGYAAIRLPANSVTTVQVKDFSLLSRDFKRGQLPAGPAGPARGQEVSAPCLMAPSGMRTAPERVGSLGVARVVTPQVAKGQARVAGFLRARTLGIRLVRTDGRKRRLT